MLPERLPCARRDVSARCAGEIMREGLLQAVTGCVEGSPLRRACHVVDPTGDGRPRQVHDARRSAHAQKEAFDHERHTLVHSAMKSLQAMRTRHADELGGDDPSALEDGVAAMSVAPSSMLTTLSGTWSATRL